MSACFESRFFTSALVSGSSCGSRTGFLPTSVTLVPMAEKKWANSHPMYPPPRMTMLLGCSSMSNTVL